MKKIAIITPGGLPMPPVKGGAVENLVQLFIESNELKKSVDFTVISCCDENAVRESLKYKNTKFIYVKQNDKHRKAAVFINHIIRKLFKGSKIQIYPFIINVIKELKKDSFDYILLENWPDYAPALIKKCGVPVLLHMHNDYFNKSSYLSKEILAGVDKVIAVSDYIKRCVLTIDESSSKVSILRNVVNIQKFSQVCDKTRRDVRNRYKISDDEIVFAFFGRMIPGKGTKELVTAFERLRKKHPNARLIMVGAEWFGKNIESDYIREIKEISVDFADSIIFTGYVDYDVIQNQYACADVVVVPSIIEEAAGMVVLEAMASSKALIVSDSGGIPEHVDSQCAISVERGPSFVDDLYKAMDKLASDRELIKAMGDHGSKRVHMYDKNNYLDNLLEIIGD
ncbi:MAG: glycosyltransferase family 4 protein [Clostridia bacterium]|nr:glycosyltransferase family 4 protein [Clostridia bacterium]